MTLHLCMERGSCRYKCAFYDLEELRPLRELRTAQLGRLVAVCGTVTRTTEVKPELYMAAFECGDCQRRQDQLVAQAMDCGGKELCSLKKNELGAPKNHLPRQIRCFSYE